MKKNNLTMERVFILWFVVVMLGLCMQSCSESGHRNDYDGLKKVKVKILGSSISRVIHIDSAYSTGDTIITFIDNKRVIAIVK